MKNICQIIVKFVNYFNINLTILSSTGTTESYRDVALEVTYGELEPSYQQAVQLELVPPPVEQTNNDPLFFGQYHRFGKPGHGIYQLIIVTRHINKHGPEDA